jgi:3-oxoacid CoA-transferase A subunit
MIKKIHKNAALAVEDIQDYSSIMVGGFGLCGNPENLISAIHYKNIKNITLISNNCGTSNFGLGILLKNKQIQKIIASYVGENEEFENQFLSGEIEVELNPQGTLAEKIRCGRSGIPAFYTNTGINTLAAGNLPMKYDKHGNIIKKSKYKIIKKFNNKEYLLEHSLKADYSFIKAYKSDTFGNLIFRKTARNFNDIMCGAAKINIVEVEHLVKLGDLGSDEIHTSGLYVQRIIEGINYKKWIEKKITRNI